MKITNRVKTAVIGLRTNKTRSALTILGIIIGIAAIILVMSIGQGAQDLILDQVRGLGSQTIIVEPGREPNGPSQFAELLTDSLKARDLVALENPANVPDLLDLTPNVTAVETLGYGSNTYRATVLGSTDVLAKILDIYPNVGDFFTSDDVAAKESFVVIGSEVKKKLFGDSDAFGEKIKIGNRVFRVVGILPAKGQVSLFNADNTAIVPYTTAMQYLTGTNHFNSIMIRAKTEALVPQTMSDITHTLRDTHKINDPSQDDFHVTSQQDAAERVKMITDILTILLVSVAAISLVVGGVGIMNIMLVSVTERTREIGLRKAIGATNADIMLQFLLEAVFLTLLGGISGILMGSAGSFTVAFILSHTVASGWTFSFPVAGAVIGVCVSGAIGLAFGIYPAREAAKKSPIEALRYE